MSCHSSDNVQEALIAKAVKRLLDDKIKLMGATPNSKNGSVTFTGKTAYSPLDTACHCGCTIGRHTNQLVPPIWSENIKRVDDQIILIRSCVSLSHGYCQQMQILQEILVVAPHSQVEISCASIISGIQCDTECPDVLENLLEAL